MPKFIIKLDKEDIHTNCIGTNILIATPQFDLIFSKDALEELINDYNILCTEPECITPITES